MTPTVLKALKGSIKKWTNILNEEGYNKGAANCPLCTHFTDDEDDIDCTKCPVMKKTGSSGCDETPYELWMVHFKTEHDGEYQEIQCNVCKIIASSEVLFLESLLPKKPLKKKK